MRDAEECQEGDRDWRRDNEISREKPESAFVRGDFIGLLSPRVSPGFFSAFKPRIGPKFANLFFLIIIKKKTIHLFKTFFLNLCIMNRFFVK